MASKRNKDPEKISKEAQVEAFRIAKGTQRPGQTKEQTKLIAQGIEKGIAEYRKLEKVKARERDKQRKKDSRAKDVDLEPVVENAGPDIRVLLPWVLLTLSWLGFSLFHLFG